MGQKDENDGCVLRGLQWLTLKLRLLEDGATPPKWKYMMLIFACFFATTFCSMFASPFLPEMMLHLGKSEHEKGTYVGLMTSSVYIGVFFGSMFWGWLADKKGRKVVLILSLVFTSLGTTAFGLSTNILMATITRFFAGLLNGVATTSRAILYDISDNTNQAIGMAMLAFSWGVGMLAGSFVGGFLAKPCSRWPDFCDQNDVFGMFPFLLPAIIPAFLSLVVAVIVFFNFDETLVKASPPSTELIVTEGDEDDSQINANNISVSVPSRKLGHAVYQKPFSQYDDCDLQVYAPVQSALSRSVTSLCPEADLSMCLGKDVLEKRDKNDNENSSRNTDAFHPDPTLKLNDGTNWFQLRNLEFIEISELPIAQSFDLLKSHKRSRAYSEGEQILNGISLKRPEISICAQQKHVVLSEKSLVEQNFPPLLTGIDDIKEDERICISCDNCFKHGCSSGCTNTSLHKLLRLSDVWSTVCLYFVLCFATIGIEDIFPVFASTTSDNGGLGFSASEIGTALGLISVPLLILQMKIYPFFVSRLRIQKTYILMALICLIDSQALPMLRSLINSPTCLWTVLIIIQTTFRIATNCCYASASLLINNSVPQELAGQVNGVSMTSSAVGRFIAPVVAGSLYSWSITHGQFIGAPFDAGFPFFLLGIFYGVSLLQCLIINPKLEKQKKIS